MTLREFATRAEQVPNRIASAWARCLVPDLHETLVSEYKADPSPLAKMDSEDLRITLQWIQEYRLPFTCESMDEWSDEAEAAFCECLRNAIHSEWPSDAATSADLTEDGMLRAIHVALQLAKEERLT